MPLYSTHRREPVDEQTDVVLCVCKTGCVGVCVAEMWVNTSILFSYVALVSPHLNMCVLA